MGGHAKRRVCNECGRLFTGASVTCAACRALIKANAPNAVEKKAQYNSRVFKAAVVTIVANGWPCAWCTTPVRLATTANHIVPLHRGGTSEWSNLAPICQRCNSKIQHRVVLPMRYDHYPITK